MTIVWNRPHLRLFLAFMMLCSAVFLPMPSSYAEGNGENLALGKEVSVTSFCNSCGTPGPNAVDGDPDTYWRALSGDARPTITLDLGKEVEWNKVVMLLNDPIIDEYAMEYSVDGEEWVEAYTLGYPPSNSVEEFVIEPINARYLRIGFSVNATGVPLLYELEIYNVDEEPSDPPASVLANITIKDLDRTYEFWDEIKFQIGDEHQFSVTGQMTDGSEADLTDAIVSFHSTRPDVVEIDENGKMTVVGYGVAKLEANVQLAPVSQSTEVFVVVHNVVEDVIWEASWLHPQMISEIGQPAILSQGGAYPSLQMQAYTDIEVAGQLKNAAEISYTKCLSNWMKGKQASFLFQAQRIRKARISLNLY